MQSTLPTRPLAMRQWRAIGSCYLPAANATVSIIAIGVDQISGNRFYVVQSSDCSPCFGVWPEETSGAAWAMPIPREVA